MPLIVQNDAATIALWGSLGNYGRAIAEGLLARVRSAYARRWPPAIGEEAEDPPVIVGTPLGRDDAIRVQHALARGRCPDCGGTAWVPADETLDAVRVAALWVCGGDACGSRFQICLPPGEAVLIDRLTPPSPRRHKPATANRS